MSLGNFFLILILPSFRAALATIRERALCPCPRCLVEMKHVDKMGQKHDMKSRETKPRTFMSSLVKAARDCFYHLGYSIASKIVDATLKPFSLMSTLVNELNYLFQNHF